MRIADMHLYQVAVVMLSCVMLFQGIRNFIKRESGSTILKLMVRLIVWGGLALTAISPAFTIWAARMIGIENNINAVILTGFILVFLMIFKLLSAIERIERNITELTRKDALKEIKRKE